MILISVSVPVNGLPPPPFWIPHFACPLWSLARFLALMNLQLHPPSPPLTFPCWYSPPHLPIWHPATPTTSPKMLRNVCSTPNPSHPPHCLLTWLTLYPPASSPYLNPHTQTSLFPHSPYALFRHHQLQPRLAPVHPPHFQRFPCPFCCYHRVKWSVLSAIISLHSFQFFPVASPPSSLFPPRRCGTQ